MSLFNVNFIVSLCKVVVQMVMCDMLFIFNEWYVVVFVEEVGCELFVCILFGKCVVFYCIFVGQVVVLEDCCVYCFFLLLCSCLEGDGIVCGYYGFCYDSQGELIEILLQKVCLCGVGICYYLFLECGLLVWIWFGDL